MDNSRQIINFVSQSFFKSLSGELTESEYAKLEDILIHHKTARNHYYDLVYMSTALKNSDAVLGLEEFIGYEMDLWQEMAEYEKTAPEIEITDEKPQSELIHQVLYSPREKRRISKFNMVFLVMNAAAVLFIVLFLKFAPSKSGVEIATVTDSIDAKWADVTGYQEKGTRLTARSDTFMLREGLVALLFDNNAKVVIEGPAEFELLSEDQINLRHGRLYATVPQEAIGFTINTQTSRIIDLGTEFGIQADAFGDVQLHVIKGKTTLIAGDKSNKTNVEVAAGQAKKVSGTTQAISDIPCQTELFVRDINSLHNFAWRGQNEIDLADIVGGGNGFGTGRRHVGLSPITGELTDITTWNANRKADNPYRRANTNPFVDGVFVPNGRTDQIISSQGHIFSECPITQGNYFTEISNTPKIVLRSEFVLGDVNYSRRESSFLFMHANLGITYDLAAIRSQLSGGQIIRFRSVTGVCDSISRPCNADFWVLVDGQVRYSRENVQQKGIPETVDIDLPENARFLTLVATDGSDPEAGSHMGRTVTSTDSDWCMFVTPVLIIE